MYFQSSKDKPRFCHYGTKEWMTVEKTLHSKFYIFKFKKFVCESVFETEMV